MRSPELLARLQKVGEYLRFENALPAWLSEFATLVVARTWTQQFEWFVHVPLALKEGISADTIAALRVGCRPARMLPEEALVYDFTIELTHHHGVSDDTYRRCVEAFGERGLMDLVGIVGYFAWMSMILNVAHTPATEAEGVEALPPLPL
jgi:4-carboxymuconolactone decarboxylase